MTKSNIKWGDIDGAAGYFKALVNHSTLSHNTLSEIKYAMQLQRQGVHTGSAFYRIEAAKVLLSAFSQILINDGFKEDEAANLLISYVQSAVNSL